MFPLHPDEMTWILAKERPAPPPLSAARRQELQTRLATDFYRRPEVIEQVVTRVREVLHPS